MEADQFSFFIQLYSKDDYSAIDDNACYRKFENELIAQQTRYTISRKTKNIREMIVARALSSTMIGSLDDFTDDYNESEEAVLKDWFDHEKNY